MPVLDCEAFCQQSQMFAIGENAALVKARFKQACQPEPISDAVKFPCLLSYPRSGKQVPDGLVLAAQSMEDLWNIFRFDEYFYFTRGWTGQLRYRAKLLFRNGGMFITEVECS